MAKLSSDGKTVTVERGDTLSEIARDYGKGLTYRQLASINGISNPNLIYIGQVIKLSGTATSSSTNNTSMAVIKQFGLQSNSDGTLFATWTWSKSNTENYEVEWCYDTGNSVWFIGNKSTTEDKQSMYSIPSNAKRVRFRVKPVSKTYTSNNKETSYWTASWSTAKTYTTDNYAPQTPSTPSVEINNGKLTAEIDNIKAGELNATGVQFQIVKNNTKIFKTGKATINTGLNYVSYSCAVDNGAEYKVRCRTYKGNVYSDWTDYSNTVGTAPAASGGIITLKALSETEVQLDWENVSNATSYKVEYTTNKRYFDSSNDVQSLTVESVVGHAEITGLESGQEYFFRVRAINDNGESAWTEIKSIVIGKDPAAPTTWSSTTTAIVGEPLILYWVHNTEDGSSQTYAELELYVDDVKSTYTIKNSTDEEEKDKTSFYNIDTSKYVENTKLRWRIRTAGITKAYGDWSVQRTIDIYAQPTFELEVTDVNGESIDILTAFPFYIKGLTGPKTQAPIGYHLIITANEGYETVDNVGNVKMVNSGESVYSKYFDTTDQLLIEMSADNIDLENNISYTITGTASMNSGLTAESSIDFTANWADEGYEPNASINFDKESITASIRPYCEAYQTVFYKVNESGGNYIRTSEVVDIAEGVSVDNGSTNVYTITGDQVFSGVTTDGTEAYYCTVEEKLLVEGVTLSVYRREFDGTFTKLADDVSNSKNTFVTDPHPALDYARYRVVAKTESTGAISYYDVPGYPIGETSAIIQWNDSWSDFDVSNEDEREQPVWSGSLLKLPYNIDVSDNYESDVSLKKYAGRKYPVAYYGTQLGETSKWNVDIPKSDKETLYALRRLSVWMGDVYVREPSGSGYWANISVSFSQTHCEVTIPVSIDIKRVEGGA